MASIDAGTRAWVEEVCGAAVVWATALRGGLSSRMYRCLLGDGETVVVRHIADADWLARDPGLIGREVTAFDLAGQAGLPVPRLLAADGPRGRLVMSFLPGGMIVTPAELAAHVDGIAAAAATIAAVHLPADHGLSPWHSWTATDPRPPDWGASGLWQRAIEAYVTDRPPPAARPVLLHRDLHPLNLLWSDGQLTGIVDWTFACVGHPHAELAHCRWNLSVLAGADVADEFVERYLALTGSGEYSPWWDLATLLGLPSDEIEHTALRDVGRTDLDHPAIVSATERMLETALARLG